MTTSRLVLRVALMLAQCANKVLDRPRSTSGGSDRRSSPTPPTGHRWRRFLHTVSFAAPSGRGAPEAPATS
jgi:hypothetical protein